MSPPFSGMLVSDILKRKKSGIRQAPLPIGSPGWDDLLTMTWEQVEAGAKANRPGFRAVRKLLADRRFDR